MDFACSGQILDVIVCLYCKVVKCRSVEAIHSAGGVVADKYVIITYEVGLTLNSAYFIFEFICSCLHSTP